MVHQKFYIQVNYNFRAALYVFEAIDLRILPSDRYAHNL